MLGSFLIFLREGIEGTLICSILMTFLVAGGHRELIRYVLGGATAAVLLSAIVGVVVWVLVRGSFVGSHAQTWFETATFLLAVCILTYMTFWMRRHSRTMGRSIRDRAQTAVDGGSAMALAGVAFATVGREAIETVIFLIAIAEQSSPMQLGIGALAGLAVALAVSYAMYRVGIRINLGRFFMVMGALLMLVAAGLLADAVGNLQALGVLGFATRPLWDMSAALPTDSGVGDVLHGILGYSAAPSLLQVGLYVAFLGVGLALFLRRPAAPVRGGPPSAASSSRPVAV